MRTFVGGEVPHASLASSPPPVDEPDICRQFNFNSPCYEWNACLYIVKSRPLLLLPPHLPPALSSHSGGCCWDALSGWWRLGPIWEIVAPNGCFLWSVWEIVALSEWWCFRTMLAIFAPQSPSSPPEGCCVGRASYRSGWNKVLLLFYHQCSENADH